MSFRVACLFLLVFASCPVVGRAADPIRTIDDSLSAMGGAARLEAIHTIDYTAEGERQVTEQSVRPTAPFFIEHFHLHETRDLQTHRTRRENTHEAWWLGTFTRTTIINGPVSAMLRKTKWVPGDGERNQEDEEQYAFAPERLLFTARAATDLRETHDVTIHGVPHHVLQFTWQGAPCTLYISAQSNLPWELLYTRAYPHDTFLNVWGDVTTSVTYDGWSFEPYGISYPHSWTRSRLGLPDIQLAVMELHINPAIDEAQLTVPAEIAAHSKDTAVDDVPLGTFGSGPPHELARGITQFPGEWNVEFVRQPDGVIVIEAPWSTGYSKRIFDVARKTYGRPIKAVITTSDSWPHLAGVRQAVAEGIPVYALDLNRPILERLLAAPHRMRPDDLQRHPRKPKFTFVTNDLYVGTGENRLEIVPYRTANGERQMMVYIPEHRMLYTSDLFSLNGSGPSSTPQYLHEALVAVAREHLDPVTIFGMHYDPMPYRSIGDALRR